MQKVKDKAQVSLEMAVAVAVALILFLGSIRLFFWVNQRIVTRQELYEESREATSQYRSLNQVNEESLSNLHLLGEQD
jgi:hypothetical protein